MHGLIPLALCISGFQYTLKTANILNHVRSERNQWENVYKKLYKNIFFKTQIFRSLILVPDS